MAKKKKNFIDNLVQRIPTPFRNKYFLVLAAFIFFMIFISRADVITQWKLSRTEKQLEADKVYYQNHIKKARKEKATQESDPERFAREKYYMSKDNEDVFVIEDLEE